MTICAKRKLQKRERPCLRDSPTPACECSLIPMESTSRSQVGTPANPLGVQGKVYGPWEAGEGVEWDLQGLKRAPLSKGERSIGRHEGTDGEAS